MDSIIIKYAKSKGGLLFHAAACGDPNDVRLIIGEGGSGKTTTLLSAIENVQNSCIANDRCLIMKENNEYFVYGLPYTINIRRESLSMFKGLNVQNIHIPKNSKNKIVFSHKQLITRNLKCGILKNILLPNCSIPNKTKINRVNGDGGRSYLVASCYSYKNIKFNDWHGLYQIEYDEKYKLDFIDGIINNIPIFNLDWGMDLVTKYWEIIKGE